MFGFLSASVFCLFRCCAKYVPGTLPYRTAVESTTLCKTPLCLLRKQLHLPHSNDLPARPRGVYYVFCPYEQDLNFFFVLYLSSSRLHGVRTAVLLCLFTPSHLSSRTNYLLIESPAFTFPILGLPSYAQKFFRCEPIFDPLRIYLLQYISTSTE